MRLYIALAGGITEAGADKLAPNVVNRLLEEPEGTTVLVATAFPHDRAALIDRIQQALTIKLGDFSMRGEREEPIIDPRLNTLLLSFDEEGEASVIEDEGHDDRARRIGIAAQEICSGTTDLVVLIVDWPPAVHAILATCLDTQPYFGGLQAGELLICDSEKEFPADVACPNRPNSDGERRKTFIDLNPHATCFPGGAPIDP